MVSNQQKNNNNNNNDLNLILKDYFGVILAVFLIVFLVAVYFLLLAPKFNTVQEAIKTNIDQQKMIYNLNQRKLADMKAVDSIYKKISPADLQKFNSVLPASYVQERLFGELEEIIGSGGWLVTSIGIVPKSEEEKTQTVTDEEGNVTVKKINSASDKKIGTINIQLSLSMINYSGFKNLLKILENNLRLFDVTKVTFSADGKNANILLSTYYYQENK